MEGMVSKEIGVIQGTAADEGRFKLTVQRWTLGLVVKLLETTHGQWLYCNVHVHDKIAGENATTRKEEIRKELEYQMSLGEEGLAVEDHYLLEINLDELNNSTGEDQAIWLIALKAARRGRQIRMARVNGGDVGHA